MKSKIIWVVIMVTCLASCSNKNRIQEEIEHFYGQLVTLPLDSMLCITDDNSEYAEFNMADNYKWVIYYDSTECSSCRLKALYEWESIMGDLSSSGHKTNFYFVFNVPEKRLVDIKYILAIHARGLPIYIDTTSVFERMNPYLPRLSQMRTFMLNRKDTVVLVGNPMYNSHIKGMMWKLLGEIKK